MGDFQNDAFAALAIDQIPVSDLPRNLLDCGGMGLRQAKKWASEMAVQYSEMVRLYHMDASGLIIVSGEGDWLSFLQQGVEESWTGGYLSVLKSRTYSDHLAERSLILDARAWQEQLSRDLLEEMQARYGVARNIMIIPNSGVWEILLRRSFAESYLDGVDSAIKEARKNRRLKLMAAPRTTDAFWAKPKLNADGSGAQGQTDLPSLRKSAASA